VAGTDDTNGASGSGSGLATAGSGTPAPPQLLGTGLMQEAVSQSASMAVQDATTYLRNIQALTMAGMAVCIEKLVQTKDATYTTLMTDLNTNLQSASETFEKIGTAASNVMKKFSSGS
jgi:hypothetical protein